MRPLRIPPANVYLALYIAATILMGTVRVALGDSFGILILLTIPILLAAAIYPRRIYLLSLGSLIIAHSFYLPYASDLSLRMVLNYVVSIIVTAIAGELARWIVTHQDKANSAAGENEKRLRALLNSIPDIVYTLDKEGLISTVNDTSLEWLEYQTDDLVDKPFISIVHPDDRAIVSNAFEEAIKGHREYTRGLQFRVLGKNGAVHWVELNSCSRLDHRGRYVQEHGVLRDITRRRRMEESLTESQRALLTLMSNLPGAAYRCRNDEQWTIEFISEGCRDLTGYRPEELIGNRVIAYNELIHPDDRKTVWLVIQDALAKNEPFQLTHRMLTRDGGEKWVWVKGRKVALRDGITILEGFVVDITERTLAEEALRASEHRYETLVNTVDGIVWEWNIRSERYTFISRQTKRLLGHLPEDWMTDPRFWEEHLHPADHDWVVGFRRQASANLQPYESEYRMMSADGRAVWLRDMVTVVSNNGEPTQLCGIMIDTTHQKLADEVTGRLNVELAQRNTKLLTLYETGQALSTTLELEEIYWVMYRAVAQKLLGVPLFFVALFNGDTQTVTCDFAVVDDEKIDPSQIPPLPIGTGPNSQTIRSREPQVVSLEKISDEPKTCYVQIGDERQPLSALYVPMLRGHKVIGVLNVQSYERQAFDDTDLTLLSTLANQAAIAIENARLIESERRQLRLAQTLQAVGSLLTAQMSLNEVLDRIFDMLAEVIAYDSVSVQLMGKDEKLYLSAWRGFPNVDHVKEVAGKISYLPFEERWGQRTAVVIPDTLADERWDRSLGFGRVRSWIGAPLWVKGRFIGVLNVDCDQPNAYNDEVAHTAEAFANQAAIAIENARLFTESEERNQRLALLNRITRTGATILDIHTLSQALVDTTAGIIGSDECYITMWDPESRVTIPLAKSGPVRDAYQSLNWKPREPTLTSSVLEAGRSLSIENTSDSCEMFPNVFSNLEVDAAVSVLGVPLHVEDHDLGALLITFSQKHEFSKEEILWAEQASELIALALSKALAYAELEKRVAERTVALTRANERLLALTELKDEFVSNVSHELRTPITSIKLYLHLLTLRPEKKIIYLERLNRETTRLEHIIEDLLQLSRMDQGRVRLKLAPTDFNKLARQFAVDRAVLAQDRGLKLRFKLKSKLPLVETDEMLFSQALSILLTNAMNYTPSGGQVEIRTHLREIDQKPWVGLSVHDTGPGIPAEDMPRLFQRFFRGTIGQESGKPGTGLGLAIAHQIVEWHQGKIEVSSTGIPGEGAVFTILMPAKAKAEK